MIDARTPIGDVPPENCAGCGGTKKAPIAGIFSIYRDAGHLNLGVTLALCEECGRDAANAIGFMCLRDGGWSKLEPRKKRIAR
jgi:rRNA maturation protein Nop10